MEEHQHVCFIDIPTTIEDTNSSQIVPTKERNHVSPMTPSPRLERNLGFFHALSRRFGRRSHDDLINYNCEDDSRSSSTDSCSSTNGILLTRTKVKTNSTHSNSNLELSCGSSDTSSNADIDIAIEKSQHRPSSRNRLTRRSTSSIRRALESFSISTRSLSCSGTTSKENSITNNLQQNNNKMHKQQLELLKKSSSNNKKPPQRILRQPVSYQYVKGISGLPTQRVPRPVCCTYGKR